MNPNPLPGYDEWKLATPPEYEEEPRDDYEDDTLDIDDLDEWVFNCGDPNCCMNFGYHFRSECYTPEMYEAAVAEMTKDEQPQCSCTFGDGSQFHTDDCSLRRGES